jgi:hypothetical protein
MLLTVHLGVWQSYMPKLISIDYMKIYSVKFTHLSVTSKHLIYWWKNGNKKSHTVILRVHSCFRFMSYCKTLADGSWFESRSPVPRISPVYLVAVRSYSIPVAPFRHRKLFYRSIRIEKVWSQMVRYACIPCSSLLTAKHYPPVLPKKTYSFFSNPTCFMLNPSNHRS